MLTQTGQIYKIDAKDAFVDIRQAFTLGEGKVVFQFRNYNKNNPVNSKITKSIDFYMEVEEFAYFADFMKTGRINKMIADANRDGKHVGYQVFGGTTKNGQVISRQLRIEGNGDGKFYLKALQGPGQKTNTSAIKPTYQDKTADVSMVMMLTDEAVRKLGVNCERAVRIFDMWCANGILEEKCEGLRYNPAKNAAPADARHEDHYEAAANYPPVEPYMQNTPPAPASNVVQFAQQEGPIGREYRF